MFDKKDGTAISFCSDLRTFQGDEENTRHSYQRGLSANSYRGKNRKNGNNSLRKKVVVALNSMLRDGALWEAPKLKLVIDAIVVC